jgi:hypothetical protein
MENKANLLFWEDQGYLEANLTKIVEFLGGTANPVRLTTEMVDHPEALKVALPIRGCLIISARALAKLGGDQRVSKRRELLAGLATHVLVYGFEPTPDDSRLLQELTSSSLGAVEQSPTAGRRINVTRDERQMCGQFSGLSFDALESGTQFTFVAGAEKGACSWLLSLGQKPFFVHLKDEHCQLLLLAGEQIADLDAAVPRGTSILKFFARLAPVVMFLRSSLREKLWHNDAPAACFIVDDPLLKKRYGFLDYQRLLELMDRRQFSTSIAFIPWNHRRSDRRIAELFASRPRSLSLCVHGCEHTRGEFGSSNVALHTEQARQALEWMRLHRTLSGLDFDDVMVFPQGIFSTAAMTALKACGYLAAVNSTAYPIDAERGPLLRDLLQVAVTCFANFPLFTRRYPHHLAELAFDLFLGKPALVVEHHGFFRDGYDALADTVQRVSDLDPHLHWTNLGMICSCACLKKEDASGDVHVQFFTDRFFLRNVSAEPQHYISVRRVAPQQEVRAVTINGLQVDVKQETDSVKTPFSLEPGESAEIKIEYNQAAPLPTRRMQNRVHQAKVFVRRSLTEFRDNYVHTSRLLHPARHDS